MTITLHLATDADLMAIKARDADIGFVPSHPGEFIVIAKPDADFADQGRIVPIDAASGNSAASTCSLIARAAVSPDISSISSSGRRI